MKIIITATIGIVVLGAIVFLVTQKEPTSSEMVGEIKDDEVKSKGEPEFSWSYEAFEEDMIPKTHISLTATYEDGTKRRQMIDTIEGDCNEYVEPDSDVYARSTMIICYYAGFGRYYKVVEADGRYAVERKEFEEASPDYEPPVQEFEVIARF